MLGVIMYAGKAAMEPLPNIHPLALFIVATTLVYRRRALYPLYAYVLINGLLVLANLVVDILYGLIDPRVKLTGGKE